MFFLPLWNPSNHNVTSSYCPTDNSLFYPVHKGRSHPLFLKELCAYTHSPLQVERNRSELAGLTAEKGEVIFACCQLRTLAKKSEEVRRH